jgi:hypothetical protein
VRSKNRDQFRIGERSHTVGGEFFTWPLILRHLADFELRHKSEFGGRSSRDAE